MRSRVLKAQERLYNPLQLELLQDGNFIASDEDVFLLLKPLLSDLPQEVVACLSLDSRGFLITASIVGIGTLTACLVHPREVFREAIRRNAASVILVHTHPSGVMPSSTLCGAVHSVWDSPPFPTR